MRLLRFACGSALAAALAASVAGCSSAPREPAIGRVADAATLAAARPVIAPDGTGLPPGHGSVREGQALYERRCANCHEVPAFPKLWGGVGSLRRFPQKSVTSYWRDAPTLYDYIARAMPPRAPGSLRPAQVYALSAYILAQDGLVRANAVVDAAALSRVKMPNHDGFFASDGKPDT
ncbi:MAG: cytochrome c [Vulcanimicrobiaceae bacterium]